VLWINRRDAWGIKTSICILALIFSIGFFVLPLYPLAGEKREQIKQQLSLTQCEKEKRFLEEHGYKFID
jgi:Na+/melibiose symporter-like transporter